RSIDVVFGAEGVMRRRPVRGDPRNRDQPDGVRDPSRHSSPRNTCGSGPPRIALRVYAWRRETSTARHLHAAYTGYTVLDYNCAHLYAERLDPRRSTRVGLRA